MDIDLPLKDWSLPYPNHQLFVPRVNLNGEDLAQTVQNLFTNSQESTMLLAAYHGLGGVGKTQLAIHLIYKLNHYRYRYWFKASSAEQLLITYKRFGLDQHIFDESTTLQEAGYIIKRWLEQHSGGLLVYDNAPSFEEIKSYLPYQGHHIIVTSRHPDWENAIEVSTLSCKDAIAFVVKFSGQTNVNGAIEQLVMQLGCLPLALAQASMYIKQTKTSVADYLDKYKTKKEQLLSEKRLPPGTYDHEPILVTWNISFDTVRKDYPLAFKLLIFCAYLYSDDISYPLLQNFLDEDQSDHLNEILEPLYKLSLIKADPINKSVFIHCVLQEVIRIHQKDHTKEHLKIVVNALNQEFNNKLNIKRQSYHDCNNLLAHSKTALDLANEACLNFMGVVLLQQHIALVYGANGNYNEQLYHCNNVKDVAEKQFKGNNKLMASVLVNLANAYGDLENHESKKTLLEEALGMLTQAFGVKSLEVAKAKINLASAYGALNNNKAKQSILEEVLPILCENDLREYLDLKADALNKLGNAYRDLVIKDKQDKKNLYKSEQYFEESLKIKINLYGKDSIQLIHILFNFALTEGTLNKNDEKVKLLNQAKAIITKYYNKHPLLDRINSLLNLFKTIRYYIASCFTSYVSSHDCNEALTSVPLIPKQYLDPSDKEFAKALYKGLFYGCGDKSKDAYQVYPYGGTSTEACVTQLVELGYGKDPQILDILEERYRHKIRPLVGKKLVELGEVNAITNKRYDEEILEIMCECVGDYNDDEYCIKWLKNVLLIIKTCRDPNKLLRFSNLAKVSTDVDKAINEQLEFIKKCKNTNLLWNDLFGNNEDVCLNTIEKLIFLGEANNSIVLYPLTRLMVAGNTNEIRHKALDRLSRLGKLNKPYVLYILGKLLVNHPFSEVRERAEHKLVELNETGHVQVIKAINEGMLNYNSPDIRQRAQEKLINFKELTFKAKSSTQKNLLSYNHATSEFQSNLENKFDTEEIKKLAQKLVNADKNIRKEAINELAKMENNIYSGIEAYQTKKHDSHSAVVEIANNERNENYGKKQVNIDTIFNNFPPIKKEEIVMTQSGMQLRSRW